MAAAVVWGTRARRSAAVLGSASRCMSSQVAPKSQYDAVVIGGGEICYRRRKRLTSCASFVVVCTSYQVTACLHTLQKNRSAFFLLFWCFCNVWNHFWYVLPVHVLLYYYFINGLFFMFLCRTQWTSGCKFQLLHLSPSITCDNKHITKWNVQDITPTRPPLFVCVGSLSAEGGPENSSARTQACAGRSSRHRGTLSRYGRGLPWLTAVRWV